MEVTHEELVKALQDYFGFDTFKGNQEAIIRNVMTGNDTFVLMPTGGGKSLCYQLPSLLMDGVAIVISPLIALMKNQVDAMRNYSEEEGVAHFINSSLSRGEINAVKDDVLGGKTKLLYLAPESLQKAENVDFLKGVKISFYAVDEAHCISEWGHDFRPEYSQIRSMVQRIGKAPIIALTATATPKVQKDIQKNLGMPDATVFKSSFNRPNLYYEVRPKTADVDKDLVRFIRSMEGNQRACWPRGHGCADAQSQPGCFPHGGSASHCSNHRVRYGYRQTRCALRRTLRYTQESRGLLSGDRTRRT